jgi:hypothetical protein
LTVRELIDGIAVDLHEPACLNLRRRLQDADNLREICPGLIDVGVSCCSKTLKDLFVETGTDLSTIRTFERSYKLIRSPSGRNRRIVLFKGSLHQLVSNNKHPHNAEDKNRKRDGDIEESQLLSYVHTSVKRSTWRKVLWEISSSILCGGGELIGL